MTQGEEEISASTLYHWASSKEAELVELPCFSVITQRTLGQPYVADTNAFPRRSLSLSISLPAHTHTHVQTQCPSAAPYVCNTGGPEVVASASPCTWGEMALCWHCAPSSLQLTVLPVIYSYLSSLDILFNHSDFVLFAKKKKKIPTYSRWMGTSEVFGFLFS